MLLVGSLLLGGCSNSSDTEEIEQVTFRSEVPETEVSSLSVLIQDLDGNSLPNIPVTVGDTEKVSDELGYVILELAEGVTTGEFSLTVNTDDYFSVTETFTVGTEEGEGILILTEKPEAGETESVLVVTESGEEEEVVTLVADLSFEEEVVEVTQVVNGETVSVSVQGSVARIESDTAVDDEGEKEVVAEVIVPVAVEPTTEDGTAAVGEITITAAVYQNDSVESVEAFPGGLEQGESTVNDDEAPAVIIGEGDVEAEDSDTSFVTAGFVSLEVTDEDGNDITEFEGSTGVDIDGDGVEEEGLLVTSLVPKSTINPETGELVALGDQIPVWSYDDQSGEKTYEGLSSIFESADEGNWNARFAVSHLSYWMLSWRQDGCRSFNSNEPAIKFLTPSGDLDTRSMLALTSRVGNGWFRRSFVRGDGGVLGYFINDYTIQST
jgi:hypothetical protein